MTGPRRFADADALAATIAEQLGNDVRLALPLGLGKSAAVANALYRRACADPTLSLHIYTALTLEVPSASSLLEARLLRPIVERMYADVPTFDYAVALRSGALPDNVRVTEFYFRPGAYLGLDVAQQAYTSINYSLAARDLAAHGVNVIAQMMAPAPDGAGTYSLSCNPDVTLELIEAVRATGSEPPLLVAETCPALPYLGGDAIVDADMLDAVLMPSGEVALFAVPNRPVSLAEHCIALRAATLIEDGGTLQIGIGSLGDAIAFAIANRHDENETFRALVDCLGETAPDTGLKPFREGLYGASEMFVEGFLHLRHRGILTRTVDGGVYLHAGFFLGSARFYEALRRLDGPDAAGLHMSRIGFTNRLLGGEDTKRRQRQGARFMNTAMKVTLDGAVVSDALENGQVISGVGGQYDFVAMAHQLEGAKSIILLPATRTAGGDVSSNILWRYGRATIPAHLRDVVITEYGIADLRGRSDSEVAARLIEIADARFQEALVAEAKSAGKLPADYRVPEARRHNLPDVLRRRLANAGLLGALPFYPLGTDLEDNEATLTIALESLRVRQGDWRSMLRGALSGWRRRRDPRLGPGLERLGLATPASLKERALALLVGAALLDEVLESDRPLLAPGPPEAGV